MEIYKVVERLIKKYGTRNPFKLADFLGIVVMHEPLGSTYGYYSKSHRTKVIHINENLSHPKQYFTCTHELAHAILHPGENTAFLKKNTLFSTDRLEVEANTFAVELLLPDELLVNHNDSSFTINDVIREMGIPLELLPLKVVTGKKI